MVASSVEEVRLRPGDGLIVICASGELPVEIRPGALEQSHVDGIDALCDELIAERLLRAS